MKKEADLSKPTLYIFSGFPASGKTTLAKLLAHSIGAMFLRIDTVENGLKEICSLQVESEGYRLSYRIIRDNLDLGLSAIADSCNTIEITRREWENIATESGATFQNIEISCSDNAEHESRVISRNNKSRKLNDLTWEQVKGRIYEQWDSEIIKIDTAGKSVEQSFGELSVKLGL